MDERDVIGFYDAFVEEQRRIGVNDRLYGLYKRLKKSGLHSRSNVLELGCGIGTMTGLLARTVKQGSIEAVDISPASIAYATGTVQKANIRFAAHDIVDHRSALKDIDFVLLYDILEHIPIERHGELFKNVAAHCSERTQVIIHIPSPGQIEYDRTHDPGALQVIDQPLAFNVLVNHFADNGLDLVFFETYGIWMEGDYQYFVLRKKQEYTAIPVSNGKSLLWKMRRRMERAWIRAAYRR